MTSTFQSITEVAEAGSPQAGPEELQQFLRTHHKNLVDRKQGAIEDSYTDNAVLTFEQSFFGKQKIQERHLAGDVVMTEGVFKITNHDLFESVHRVFFESSALVDSVPSIVSFQSLILQRAGAINTYKIFSEVVIGYEDQEQQRSALDLCSSSAPPISESEEGVPMTFDAISSNSILLHQAGRYNCYSAIIPLGKGNDKESRKTFSGRLKGHLKDLHEWKLSNRELNEMDLEYVLKQVDCKSNNFVLACKLDGDNYVGFIIGGMKSHLPTCEDHHIVEVTIEICLAKSGHGYSLVNQLLHPSISFLFELFKNKKVKYFLRAIVDEERKAVKFWGKMGFKENGKQEEKTSLQPMKLTVDNRRKKSSK